MRERLDVALLRDRANWYDEGCPFLEDLDGYLRNGLNKDAASDLRRALAIIDELLTQLLKSPALDEPHFPHGLSGPDRQSDGD